MTRDWNVDEPSGSPQRCPHCGSASNLHPVSRRYCAAYQSGELDKPLAVIKGDLDVSVPAEIIAENERLQRWFKLLQDAPGEAKEIIRERCLSSEYVQPIVEDWKRSLLNYEKTTRKLAEENTRLVKENSELRAQINIAAKPEHDWRFYANGTFCTKCGQAIGTQMECWE